MSNVISFVWVFWVVLLPKLTFIGAYPQTRTLAHARTHTALALEPNFPSLWMVESHGKDFEDQESKNLFHFLIFAFLTANKTKNTKCN